MSAILLSDRTAITRPRTRPDTSPGTRRARAVVRRLLALGFGAGLAVTAIGLAVTLRLALAARSWPALDAAIHRLIAG
jgi:hypothetical protein